MAKTEKKGVFLKRLLFPDFFQGKSASQRIAYIALLTAFCVVVNSLEFKFADVQFSFTMLFSILSGILLGSVFGFCACFLGDLVGFLHNSGGYIYMPWVGIALGLTAMIAGAVYHGIPSEKKIWAYGKLTLIALATFLLCTIAINTTAFWILYAQMKTSYFTYLFSRLFIQGQIWNSLVNYALTFFLVPILAKIKILKIKFP